MCAGMHVSRDYARLCGWMLFLIHASNLKLTHVIPVGLYFHASGFIAKQLINLSSIDFILVGQVTRKYT